MAILSLIHNPGLIYEKNVGQMPAQEHPMKYLAWTPQNCQGHQNKETENLSQPREARGGMMTKYNCTLGFWVSA